MYELFPICKFQVQPFVQSFITLENKETRRVIQKFFVSKMQYLYLCINC